MYSVLPYRASKTPDRPTVPALCTAECCRTLVTPYQPCDKAVIESTRQQVGKKSETRTGWYKDFKWLHVCVTQKKVFCFYCLDCYQKGALNFTKKYDTAFILGGFCNWKKARERFERHEKSESHREAVVKLRSMQGPSIITQLSNEVARNQAERRNMLVKQLQSLKCLLRQGLPIRGHRESEGNLIQLLEMQASDCPPLKLWLSDNHYLSHGVVNDYING